MIRLFCTLPLLVCLNAAAWAEPVVALPDTKPLEDDGDLSAKMLAGLHRFAERKTVESVKVRSKHWQRDLGSAEAYEKSIQPNRERFRRIIGLVDERVPAALERFGDEDNPAPVAETSRYRVYQVRWPVLEGVWGEGLLLEPRGKPVGHVVTLPDADQTPEQIAGLTGGIAPESQFARRLAENGFQVLVPTLVSRGLDFSGNPRVAMTNQPHREWVYRQAFHMGRHVIGYEVQKVLAAVDWFRKQAGPKARVGVAGHGEGGLIAFYTAAADSRIDAVLVSGYFGPRERLWEEPIYRNVWGLLHEFGDAEIATLVAPRAQVVECSEGPRVDGPPPVPKGRRGGAAVGKLGTPSLAALSAEFRRIDTLLKPGFQSRHLVSGDRSPVPFGSQRALAKFVEELGIKSPMALTDELPKDQRKSFDPLARQRRQVKELENHVQGLVRGADQVRDAYFLNTTTLIRTLPSRGERFRLYRAKEQSAEVFAEEARKYRTYLAEEVLGRLDDPVLPPNPRSRRIYDKPKWVGYDVVLDVYPDVFAWGVLLVLNQATFFSIFCSRGAVCSQR